MAEPVRQLVARAEPRVPYAAAELMSVANRLALFCRGYGIDQPRQWLAPPTVEWFLEVGCAQLSPGTRGTYRSRLTRLREAVYGPDNGVGPPASLAANDPARPYGPREQAALWSCALGQPTATLRRGMRTLQALGLGCGLDSSEAMRLLLGHVRDCGQAGVVVVHIPPPRERLVVCRRRWEPMLREVVADADTEAEYLLLPRARRGKNLVTNFLARTHRGPTTPPISMVRMRASWLAELLARRVPLTVVVAAAGLESLRSIDTLLPYLPAAAPGEAEQWLRGQP